MQHKSTIQTNKKQPRSDVEKVFYKHWMSTLSGAKKPENGNYMTDVIKIRPWVRVWVGRVHIQLHFHFFFLFFLMVLWKKFSPLTKRNYLTFWVFLFPANRTSNADLISFKGLVVIFGDSFCRRVWGVCLSWISRDYFFSLFFPLAAKLIGPQTGCQFLKIVDLFDNVKASKNTLRSGKISDIFAS